MKCLGRVPRALATAAWENALKPLIESAFVVVMLGLAMALMLGIFGAGKWWIDANLGGFQGISRRSHVAAGGAFFFLCLVAIAVGSKVVNGVSKLVDRMVRGKPDVTFDRIREGNRPMDGRR